jgi:alpha-tubulin suppressor-like RCC1 family protein
MLGQGTADQITKPAIIHELDGQQIVGISGSGSFTVAWTDEGKLFSWGKSTRFRTGHDDENDVLIPRHVKNITDDKMVLVAACGSDRTLALLGWSIEFWLSELLIGF